MNEDDAKTKWCPFASVDLAGATGRTAFGKPDPDCLCIASACMAWRWDDIRNPDWRAPNSMQYPPPHPADEPQMYIKSTTHGSCGLARK